MENYEYNKTFRFEDKSVIDLASDNVEDIAVFLNNYENKMRKKPRYLHPFAHAIFEKTILDCEKIAEEFSGRIKAQIDYSRFTATIELWCCYVEFGQGEFMNILHRISIIANSVRFTPLTSGDLHIEIEMPYFVSSQDIEDDD